MTARPSPPGIALRLLCRLVPRDQREFAGGDLEEEFRRRCGRDGVRAARTWARGQAARAVGPWLGRVVLNGARIARSSPRHAIAGSLADAKFAVRTAARRPATSLLVVATLGIGIGATTAVFTISDRVLFRGLPFERSEELVDVWNTYPSWQGHHVLDALWDRIGLSYPEYEAWRAGQSSFEEIAIYGQTSMALTGAGEPALVPTGRASPSLWPLLGTNPRDGRLFSDDDVGGPAVAVVGHDLWRSRWGGAPDLIGRTIRLDDRPVEVIGILPAGFRFFINPPGAPDVQIWLPAGGEAVDRDDGNHIYEAVARTGPGGVTPAVEEETRRLVSGGRAPDARGIRISSRHAEMVGTARAPLLLSLAAVGLLMVLACVNVATLLLGRVAARRAELATRATLGAGRRRLVRQLLVEALLFGVVGSLLGLGVGAAGLRFLVRRAPVELGIPPDISLDPRILAFTVILGLAASLVFGLVPSLVVRRLALEREVRSGSGRILGGGWRTQRGLVAAQFALSLVLLVGTGLLLRSLAAELSIDPGFERSGILTLDLSLPDNRYPTGADRSGFLEAVTERLEGVPGVSLVSGSSGLPFSGRGGSSSFDIAGREVAEDEKRPEAVRRSVLPRFHEALGIPVVRGRGFEPFDRNGAPAVAVVSEAMEARFWPDASAIGEAIIRDNRRWEVVGVVGDVLVSELTAGVDATFYTPIFQEEAPIRSFVSLVIRTDVDPSALAGTVRAAVAEIDPSLPIERVEPLAALVARSTATERYRTVLLAAIAITATALAGIGIFGVSVRSLASRRREMGIRVAVGAEPGRLLAEVLRREATPLAIGVATGVALAFAASRLIAGFLYRVTPADPVSFAAAIAGLTVVGLAATLIAARRVLRLDPAEVLRAD